MSTRRPRRRRRPVSAATRKKISAALRGKKHPHRGVHPSAATRAKESRSHRGKRHPHRGHRMSAATRAKISRALKGRHHKSRCHCGSSSKHSLTRRRARHSQWIATASSAHPGIWAATASKVTKHRTKKRNKIHTKARTYGHGIWAVTESSVGKRGAGKCRCPKKNAKHHARIRRTRTRLTHTHPGRNVGTTSIQFPSR